MDLGWDRFLHLVRQEMEGSGPEEDREAWARRRERERAALPASGWAQGAWQRAQKAGLFDGTAPRAPLTREQCALVLERLGLLPPAENESA